MQFDRTSVRTLSLAHLVLSAFTSLTRVGHMISETGLLLLIPREDKLRK